MLDQNIKKWAQSSFSIDVFTHRALKFTHFTRPVAKFVHENVEKQSGKMKKTKKVAEALFPTPPLTLFYQKRPLNFEDDDMKNTLNM